MWKPVDRPPSRCPDAARARRGTRAASCPRRTSRSPYRGLAMLADDRVGRGRRRVAGHACRGRPRCGSVHAGGFVTRTAGATERWRRAARRHRLRLIPVDAPGQRVGEHRLEHRLAPAGERGLDRQLLRTRSPGAGARPGPAGTRPGHGRAPRQPSRVQMLSTTTSGGRSGHWSRFGRLSGKLCGWSRRSESISGATSSPGRQRRDLGARRPAARASATCPAWLLAPGARSW